MNDRGGHAHVVPGASRECADVSSQGSVTVNVAPPSGLLLRSHPAAMGFDDGAGDGEPNPDAVGFRRDEGLEQLPVMFAGRPVPASRTETLTLSRVTSLCTLRRRRSGGVSAIASMALIMRLTSTCCRST